MKKMKKSSSDIDCEGNWLLYSIEDIWNKKIKNHIFCVRTYPGPAVWAADVIVWDMVVQVRLSDLWFGYPFMTTA